MLSVMLWTVIELTHGVTPHPSTCYTIHINTNKPMAFAIYVTETVVTSYEFETEAEARAALESGDFWHMESEVEDAEVTDTEIVKLG